MVDLEDLIKQGEELAQRHDDIRNEVLNNPDIPQDFKDIFMQLGDNLKPALEIIKNG